jgi:hypothetical protein
MAVERSLDEDTSTGGRSSSEQNESDAILGRSTYPATSKHNMHAISM